jgi:hypothetical protein
LNRLASIGVKWIRQLDIAWVAVAQSMKLQAGLPYLMTSKAQFIGNCCFAKRPVQTINLLPNYLSD